MAKLGPVQKQKFREKQGKKTSGTQSGLGCIFDFLAGRVWNTENKKVIVEEAEG